MLDVRFNIEGLSYENRPIISTFIGYKGRQNPIVFIDAGIHAREWHSRNLALNILFELGNEAELGVNGFLYNVSVLIVPNANPDGYEYSLNHYQMWRKTRRPADNNCYGIDGNRNFDIEWHSLGPQERNPCEDVYRGPNPFSEPETQAIVKIMQQIRNQCFLYISIHTFGDKILYPPGYSTQPHPRRNLLHRVAQAGVDAVLKRTGTKFEADQSGSK